MLFSRDDVSAFVNRNFEPVWVMVRPVPTITIDFGNGTVLNRTLNGNIATYACTPDGEVLDIVAGIYEPKTYIERLNQFRLLAGYADAEGAEKRKERLADYHKQVVAALVKDEPAPELRVPLTKRKIEGPVKATLGEGVRREKVLPKDVEGIPEDLAEWKVLHEDTLVNETIRRKQVSEMLTASGPVKPDAIYKKIYKEVLLADLDDPYLGLGKMLFANYPFKDGK